MLKTVTLTGADDTAEPKSLIALSKEFPFVEWGILVGSHAGKSRFPSTSWIGNLLDEIPRFSGPRMNLSLHVCGRILSAILKEGKWIAGDVDDFNRMQLNITESLPERDDAREAIVTNIMAVQSLTCIPEIIIRIDHLKNDWLLDALLLRNVKASGLYDRSHGAGLKPDSWPKANPDWNVGYAGGIGPETVLEDVRAILAVAGAKPTWIDMETSLFTNGKFDLGRCRFVLETCREFIAR